MTVIYEREAIPEEILSPYYLAVKFCYIEGNKWNPDLLNHLERVGAIFSILAKEYCKINDIKFDLPDFWVIGFLHDIGKFEQRDMFSNDVGKFEPEQRLLAQRHPEDGVNILRKMGVNSERMLEIILQHHERIDGQGYPRNLTANEIDDLAQLLSIADVLEACTSISRGRFQFTKTWDDAHRALIDEAGVHYNYNLLSILENCWQQFDYLKPISFDNN